MTDSNLNPDYALLLMKYVHSFRPRDLFYLLPRNLNVGQLFREMSKAGMVLRNDKIELNIDAIAARLKEASGFLAEDPECVNHYTPQGARARDAVVELCWFAQTQLSSEELTNNLRLFELITYVVSHPTLFNCGNAGVELENAPGLLVHHALQWYLSNVPATNKQAKSLKTWYEKCGAPEFEEGPQELEEKDSPNPDYARPLLKYSHTRLLRHLFYLLPRHLDAAQMFREMSKIGLGLPGNQSERNLDTIGASLKVDRSEDQNEVDEYPPSQLARARDAVVELCWFSQTKLSSAELTNNIQLFELVTYIVSHPAIFNCGNAGVPLENEAGLLVHHALHWYLSIVPATKSQTESLNSWYEKCTGPACKDDSEDVYLNSAGSIPKKSKTSGQKQEEQGDPNPDYAPTFSKFSLSGRPKHLFSYLPRHLDPAQLIREMSKLGLVLPRADSEPNLDAIGERVKDVRVFRGKNYDGINDYPPSQRPRARDAVVELCWYAQTKYSSEDLANNTQLFELISYIVSHPAIFNCGNAGVVAMDTMPGLLLHHALQWYLLTVPVSKKQTKVLMTLYEKCTAPEFGDDPEAGYSSSGGSVSDPSDDDESDVDGDP